MIKKLIAALLVTSVLAGGTSLVPRNALAYNRPAAANYADAFWSAFNNAYPYFGAPPWPASIISNGDDCTNFVSQALHAGGIATREAANEPWQAVSSTTYWYAHTNGGGLYGKAGWTTSWRTNMRQS
jgi:hypothetical protein